MYGDFVLSVVLCECVMLNSKLIGEVNLLLFLNLDLVNIVYNFLKVVIQVFYVGLIFLGVFKFVYILMFLVMFWGVVNMLVFVSVEVQMWFEGQDLF